ncbi:uncharacterized protein TNCV_1300011 [Trichonephila clavipes]|nr:uncharacterized protein TNCV_1300011 [Trichonephila clavipes]
MPPNTLRVLTEYMLAKSVAPKVLCVFAEETTGEGDWRIFPSPPVLNLNCGDGNRDLELEVNEDGIEELIMGHEDELSVELQEILNEEHQETQRNVSPSEQEEDERGLLPTSTIKDLLKKWEDVRAMVLEWHPNQADVSRFGDLYNNNAINYFRKILRKI